MSSEEREDIPAYRKTMGQVKFASLRRTFKILKSGERVPKNDYSFRVDARKVAATMQFMQQSLQLKPGYTRDVCLAGYVFHSMPVYERGANTCEELFSTYKASMNEALTVGEPKFRDILKLLTKRGQTKAGLSTYYIRMRDFSKIFVRMMHRIKEIVSANANGAILEEHSRLLEKWSNIQQFILWSYSHDHLHLHHEDILHCCSFALGGLCRHNHEDNDWWCNKCADTLTFFDKVQSYIQTSIIEIQHDPDVDNEIDLMLEATKRF